MILNLSQSKLFTVDPAKRFALEHRVSEDIWKELWRRYKMLDYTAKELCEVYYINVGGTISKRVMNRWIFRTQVYNKVRPLMEKGAQAVNSEYFGELEERVVAEVLKHLKSGGIKNTKILA